MHGVRVSVSFLDRSEGGGTAYGVPVGGRVGRGGVAGWGGLRSGGLLLLLLCRLPAGAVGGWVAHRREWPPGAHGWLDLAEI